MKHRILLLLFAISFVTVGFAQQTQKISLQEAINLSLSSSSQAKLNSAKIEEATALLKQAIERKLPDASATASYLRLTSPHIKLKTAKDTSGTPQQSSTPKVNQAAYGMLNISYPIYSGNRIKYGIEAARLLENATRLDADFDKQDIAFNAVEAYTNLIKANTAVSIVKENLTQAQQRVIDFTSQEKNGLIARNDLMKAELQSSLAELALFDAENNSKLANVALALLLGLPQTISIIPDTTLQSEKDIQAFEMYEQQALQNRKDIGALALRRQAAGVGIKSAKGAYYPSIALSGGYVAAYVPNLITITNAVNVGIGVKYDIGSLWKTKSKIAEAEAKQKQLVASESMLNDAIRLQTYNAYENYLLSTRRLSVLQKAIEQSEENYRITKNKYDNSLATTTDLLDADVAQLQARLNMANAKTDAVTAYYRLQEVTGNLIK